MFDKLLASTMVFGMLVSMGFAQDDGKPADVYSGPQVGEVLPGFVMKLGFGEDAGSDVDLVASAGNDPIVIIFVHQRSRPAFGLANAVMRYCEQEGGDKLHHGICFLTGDATETANWMGKIKNYFPAKTPVGFSSEGIEGPGAYGLNRNVELTVLVGKDNKVTANFALIQPGAHVDGPKILEAIASATGVKSSPDINNYLPNNQAAQDTPITIDPGLMAQVRKINARDASEEIVGDGITEIEKMIQDNKPLQNQLGSVVSRWVATKRVDSIGNEDQQTTIKNWAREYGPKMNGRGSAMDRDRPQPRESDPTFTALLRGLIQKSNTDERVDSAAKKIEEYVAKNPAAEKELARITNTIVHSDKLSNYGTPHAQETLKNWAQKYPTDKQ
jgi:hypothetical protein